MSTGFSPSTLLWIEKQGVLGAAERRFREEWAAILEDVQRQMAGNGWLSRRFGDPLEMLQLARREWPHRENQIYYEVLCQQAFVRKGIVDFSLHVESSTPNQKAVCDRLRQLLGPYSSAIVKALSNAAPDLPDSPIQDIIKARLPLGRADSSALGEVLSGMMETESFMDEALFLAGRNRIWRTGFFKEDPRPDIRWFENLGSGPEGGWQWSEDGGRLNSPCLKCQGGLSNYHEGKNILQLRPGVLVHDLCNGQAVYGSAAVHSSQGGHLTFYAEAPKDGGWTPAFTGECDIQPLDRWQVVHWEGAVANPDNWDFAKQGAYWFLIVKAPESGLRIDSVEIGGCGR